MSRTHFPLFFAAPAPVALSSSSPRPSLCPPLSLPFCQRGTHGRCESDGARRNRCRCSFPCPGACFLAFMRPSSFMDPAVFVTRADSHPRRLKTTVGRRARALLTGSRVANTCTGWPVQHISSISVRVPCAQLVADHDAEALNASALCVALLTRAQPHAHRVVGLKTSYIARTLAVIRHTGASNIDDDASSSAGRTYSDSPRLADERSSRRAAWACSGDALPAHERVPKMQIISGNARRPRARARGATGI